MILKEVTREMNGKKEDGIRLDERGFLPHSESKFV